MTHEAHHLICNAGSATFKFSLYQGANKKVEYLFDREGGKFVFSDGKGGRGIRRKDFEDPLGYLLQRSGLPTIDRMGFRFVHGGPWFREPTVVTEKVIRKLRKLDELAPLHNPPARRLVERSMALTKDARKLLVFDTGFHSTLSEQQWRYALPMAVSDKHGIRRYGFHGIAAESALIQLKERGKLPKRIILCHLGGGASVTAIRNGKSFATSMGMTPLEGLIMGSRTGDVDPGVLLFLLGRARFSLPRLEKLLQHESGLTGLCGTSDMREILKRKQPGNRFQMAFDLFCSRVAEYAIRYAMLMGGLDLMVFSGGIGENSTEVRNTVKRLLKPLVSPAVTHLHVDEAEVINKYLPRM